MRDKYKLQVTGKFLKVAELREEWLIDIDNPDKLMNDIIDSHRMIDLFTFCQRLPNIKPKFRYYMEWDNVAAVPIIDFDYWFTKQVRQEVRNKIRKAKKSGVTVKYVEFNDNFVKDIMTIFNEIPIRRGRPYMHYGKNKETVTKEWSDHLEKAVFLGAFYNEELVGFIKLLDAGNYIRTSGTISKFEHRKKSVMNALISESVKYCEEVKAKFLVYGKFVYGKKGEDSLSKFKRSNGFEMISIPRYYMPLTFKGKIFLYLNLHHGIIEVLPEILVNYILKLREFWYAKFRVTHS